MMRIVEGAPIWVWPVFVGLVSLGVRALRERDVPVWPIYLMPLAGILSVRAVFGLHAGGMGWGIFAVAYGAGLLWGRRVQIGIVVHKADGRVRLRGEWITLAVLMGVFWMNFLGGVTRAISPEVYASGVFQVGFAIAAGLAAGSFAGRALAVWRA